MFGCSAARRRTVEQPQKIFDLRVQLDVHFQTDDGFVFVRCMVITYPPSSHSCGRLLVMVGLLLVRVRGAQHRRFVERLADHLQADRQSVRKPARHADRRHARPG